MLDGHFVFIAHINCTTVRTNFDVASTNEMNELILLLFVGWVEIISRTSISCNKEQLELATDIYINISIYYVRCGARRVTTQILNLISKLTATINEGLCECVLAQRGRSVFFIFCSFSQRISRMCVFFSTSKHYNRVIFQFWLWDLDTSICCGGQR